ncbi:MAG TPA: TonB-dependent receptor [Ignavibacteriaceae bacterium]|nr:TonB-dependent receptor [Ignavibacteriaceae bacterium]
MRKSSKKYLSKLFLLISIAVALSTYQILYAQVFTISGKVLDSKSNPIPGVNVILLNTNYGAATNDEGAYEILNLPSGNYTIEFSAIGFEKIRKENVVLENESFILDVILIESVVLTDEVLITAGKYEQKKSDLTVSTEIISGKEFTERNFSNLEDAVRFVPGVTMTEDQISIRGSNGYSRGTGSRALLAIDGLPFYTGDSGDIIWEMIPTLEIQKVEIIKGASSSLYGSSAIGGVINSLTRDISDKPLTIFNGFYGVYDKPYYNEWDWSGGMRPFNGLTLSHSQQIEKFGFNVSLTRLEESSYKQDDDFKKYIGFLKAVYNFTPTSSLTLLANTFNKRAGQFLYWKDSRNALVPPDQNLGDRIETNRYLFGLIYKSLLVDQVLMNIKTSYYRNYFKDNADIPNESTSNLYRGEVQLHSTITNYLVLTGGVEGTLSGVESSLFGNPDAFSLGAYLVGDINFSFPLIASIGVRYDYSKLDSLEGSGAVSPKLGLNYKLSKDFILRSSLGTGFRAPTTAEAFTSTATGGITVKPNPNIKSEYNLTFEFGVNYTPISFVNIDGAVFQNEYYDMIEPGIDPEDGLVFFSNLVRARIQGGEAGVILNLLPNELSLSFSYTYLWARDLETGTALRYRPRHIFYSGLDFRKWNFDFGINFRYTSRVEEIDDELVDLGIVVDGDLRVPVYTTDVNLGYNFITYGLPMNIYLNIKNIFNYNYVELIGNIRKIRNYSFGFNLAF